ncbi:MAG TPA: methyltransferase domain-containing protein, partial [Acidocella sp.]|nr:methyltransferase domain-containing protein [Acidocella sp.]
AKVACASLKNCDWLLGNAMELHLLLHDLVDYVLIANTFHGAPDKTELAREIGRVLKSKGRLAIINWYPLPREETVILGKPRGPATALRMSPEQTEAAVEPAGYKLEKRVEFPPYHYGAIFLRTN